MRKTMKTIIWERNVNLNKIKNDIESKTNKN